VGLACSGCSRCSRPRHKASHRACSLWRPFLASRALIYDTQFEPPQFGLPQFELPQFELLQTVVARIVVQQNVVDQPLWLELRWNQTGTFISPLQEVANRGPCLEEGPALGPFSRGWFWSLWGLFWCLCDAFRKSNSHSYSPLSLFLLASLWGLIVGQIGPKPALCSYSCLFLALGDRFWASDSTNAYFESSAFQ
jgi:hypothetical protein